MLDSALVTVADAVTALVAGRRRALVIIDGRSGTGKSTLAAALADRIGAQVVPLDGLYPGWDGLAEGTDLVLHAVIRPYAAATTAVWHRYDWEHDRYLADDELVDPAVPLIVEGCGALTADSARLSDVSIWLDGDADHRRERALKRDGELYRPHWDRWAAQEDVHIAMHGPAERATIAARV